MRRLLDGAGRFAWLLLAAAPLAAADQKSRPIIDTHAHLEHVGRTAQFGAALEAAVAQMERLGVAVTVLMPPPQATENARHYEIDALLFAQQQHPGRFALLGGGSLNLTVLRTPPEAVDDAIKRSFREQAEALLAQGAIGFGEMTAHHLSLPMMGPQHGYSVAEADHPLLRLLADIAAEHEVPIDLHFDVVPEAMSLPAPMRQNRPNPAQLAENLAAFERLLAHNRKAKIIWAHAGSDPLRTRTPELCGDLLARHPNLYMSLRAGARGTPHPSFALDESGRLKPVWLRLLAQFPDRFVLGSDQFHATAGARSPLLEQLVAHLRGLANQLPADLAQRIAVDNANALYRLPARPPSGERPK